MIIIEMYIKCNYNYRNIYKLVIIIIEMNINI